MKKFKYLLVVAGLCLAASRLTAADAKDYQVTGPVLEVTPSYIVVQKGEERWQIATTKDTKGLADAKVGDKVTIYYKMSASEVEVKPAKADKPAKAEKPAKTEKKG
jgi:hypothetical protein